MARRTSFATSALISALVTAPAMAVLYLVQVITETTYLPFAAFDRLTRALPGPLVNTGVETVAATVRWIGVGSTSTAAKLAEQSLAVASFFVVAVGVGTLLVPLVRRRTLHRAGSREIERLDRRRLLIRMGAASAVITVSGTSLGRLLASGPASPAPGDRWSAHHPLPNADARVTPVPGTRPELTPLEDHYRIDINTIVPRIDATRWSLRVEGLVARPMRLTLEDIRTRYEPTHLFVTLSCISNAIAGDLIGTTRWTGVSLARLLPDFELASTATHLRLTSRDGFFEVVGIDQVRADPRIMLAYAWDGVPLAHEHGFPLRLYVPGVYGMKQPKWIDSIEAIDAWQPGFWVERGWDARAEMQTTSAIDVVAPGQERDRRVAIGGIAHAGDRGISKVEVRVDAGAWQDAEVRRPLSGLTWVLWRFDWPFQAGRHRFTVRCTDGHGTLQSSTPSRPFPDGATGLHEVTRSL